MMIGPTPGRQALDDLRFELKRGDAYEQHLSSRIEDGLDAQTVAWEQYVQERASAGVMTAPDWCWGVECRWVALQVDKPSLTGCYGLTLRVAKLRLSATWPARNTT